MRKFPQPRDIGRFLSPVVVASSCWRWGVLMTEAVRPRNDCSFFKLYDVVCGAYSVIGTPTTPLLFPNISFPIQGNSVCSSGFQNLERPPTIPRLSTVVLAFYEPFAACHKIPSTLLTIVVPFQSLTKSSLSLSSWQHNSKHPFLHRKST